jgi:hypothetical protein
MMQTMGGPAEEIARPPVLSNESRQIKYLKQRTQGYPMYDNLQIRCPKLGGEITFAYCKQENGGHCCSRALVCWQFTFPVAAHLKDTLTKDEWDRCFNQPPKDRMTSLLEVIEEAKKRHKLAEKD